MIALQTNGKGLPPEVVLDKGKSTVAGGIALPGLDFRQLLAEGVLCKDIAASKIQNQKPAKHQAI